MSSDKYDKEVYLAMLAEQCNRYEDMSSFLDDMVASKKEGLTSDERNLLSIAYKNTISLRRTALRTLLAYEMKEKKKTESAYLSYIMEYKKKLEDELIDLCTKIIKNIDAYLLPKSADDEARVFYHKMKADYFRYIAENIEGDSKKTFSDNSLKSYEEASEIAKNLPITNPIRLGLALNFSVFHYEVLNNQDLACKIAKDTLDQANKDMAGVDMDEDENKDAQSILSLLSENLNMWTNENM
jgi:14-3-3 protein epsilon